MPIPILLTVRELGIGGCERDLTKVALGLDRSRFEPHVGCFLPDGLRSGELRAHGVPIVQFEVRSMLSDAWKGARQLGAYVKKHRIQVMHAFDVPMDLFAVPVARFYGTPAVISSRLSYRELMPSDTHRFLVRLADKTAHAIVVNSRAVQTELIEMERVPPHRTVLSYNGVDLGTFRPEPRVRKAFPDASLIIGAVCALRPEKRLDLLVDAFARIQKNEPNARLLIVGSGPMLQTLERQTRELGIQSFCHFEPSKTDVAEWMRSIDVFVMASESESFPNALLEAMACGCCVVGSRVGGVPELISDGENGLVFNSRDVEDLSAKLRTVISDRELREGFARKAARRAADEFSIQAAVDRLQTLYVRLLKRASV